MRESPVREYISWLHSRGPMDKDGKSDRVEEYLRTLKEGRGKRSWIAGAYKVFRDA